MLDQLPAWARHLIIVAVIVPAAAAAGIIGNAILGAQGVTGIVWDDVLTAAMNAAAVSAAAGLLGYIALAITPLTRQYGVGVEPVQQVEPVKPARRPRSSRSS